MHPRYPSEPRRSASPFSLPLATFCLGCVITGLFVLSMTLGSTAEFARAQHGPAVQSSTVAEQLTRSLQGAHGQVSLNGDGTVRYVPARRFKGGDSFSYTITDGVDTAAATVTVTVQPKSGGGK